MILLNAPPAHGAPSWAQQRESVIARRGSTVQATMQKRLAAITFGAVVLATAAGLALPVAGASQDPVEPSADRGHELAHRLCQDCHAIADGVAARNPTVAGIPSFRALANQPGQTGDHIKGILIAPHKPMPDMHLTNQEILDLIAYLETLRTDPSVPPLLPPASKPTVPETQQPS